PAAHHAAPYRRIDLTRRVAALVSLLFVVRVFERHVARRSTGATAAARPMAPGSRPQLAIAPAWCPPAGAGFGHQRSLEPWRVTVSLRKSISSAAKKPCAWVPPETLHTSAPRASCRPQGVPPVRTAWRGHSP